MTTEEVKPKKLIVHVAEEDIADLKQRLNRTRYIYAPMVMQSLSFFPSNKAGSRNRSDKHCVAIEWTLLAHKPFQCL